LIPKTGYHYLQQAQRVFFFLGKILLKKQGEKMMFATFRLRGPIGS
jgi:hypothetical protein